MKRYTIVLFVLAIVCSSCSEQHKVKMSVQKYLGEDAKVLECVYTENDTILTYNEQFELLEQIDKLDDEARHYRRLSNEQFLNGSATLGDRYGREACKKLEDATLLWKMMSKLKPKHHVLNTATVVYIDTNGNETTDVFIVSNHYSVTGTQDSIGITQKSFYDAWHKHTNKPLE